MENMNSIEQEINRKKRYLEIEEKQIPEYLSNIERYKLEIEKIEKCKCLKDLRDYSNVYAYNGEKYICYDIGEGDIDHIYEYDTFKELKEHAIGRYKSFIETNNNLIKKSNELMEKIKADIDRLRKILLGMVNNI